MSLDDPRSHKAAAMADDDQHPGWLEVRQSAKGSLSSWLAADHELRRFFGPAALDRVAARLVGDPSLVCDYLRPVAATDRDDRRKLRSQQTASLDDAESLEEDIHLLQRELAAKEAMLADVRRRHVPDHDPDARLADEDDRRVSVEVASERAVTDAPRVRAS